MKHFFLLTAVMALSLVCLESCGSRVVFTDQTTTIEVEAGEVISDVSPLMYGLMTEEINYSYDGGLYAELIRNRTFQAPDVRQRRMPRMPQGMVPGQRSQGQAPQGAPQGQRPQGGPQGQFPQGFPGADGPSASPYVKGLSYWKLIVDGAASGEMTQDSLPQPGTALKRNLRLDIAQASEADRVAVANEGYWGIPVHPNTRYTASFYACTDGSFAGGLTVSIESNDGTTVYAKGQVEAVSQEWKRYELVLETDSVEATSDTRFVIAAHDKGRVWFSLVSLFPPTWNDRPNGLRTDLMALMQGMKPAFLRFPGGNYLQGKTLATRFDWKQMIGRVEDRPTHYNDSWGYHSSDGMGLLEYMYWCEDLQMEPILGVFAGFTLNSPSPLVGEDLEPYVQDALNEIEYLTGPVTSEWGALRAQHGHPEPFSLKYVEVGNEDFFDRVARTYDQRFTQIYKAIKAKYPDMVVIASDTTVVSVRPDMVDLHQYMRVNRAALAEAHRYDHYDRTKPQVIIGEYATRDGSPTTNHRAGLYDAAYLMGLERNADIIRMSCFAPIFVNVNPGGMQWDSDLMGYNGMTSYGSPSFYVQSMFSNNLGTELVKSSISAVPVDSLTRFEQVYYSVTKDPEKKMLYLKVVNISGQPQPVQVAFNGVKIASRAAVTVLSSASDEDTNDIEHPMKIVPATTIEKGFGSRFVYQTQPYSVYVFALSFK